MRMKSLFALILVIAIAGMYIVSFAEEAKEAKEEKKAEHSFVGFKTCKMCHNKEVKFYDSWLATKHATAWDNLSDADKAKDEFKKYYTTGIDAKGNLLGGVQCEACHGAGKDYKKKTIMKDREQAVANGLMIPDENTCKSCHNEKATPALAATAKDFDFAKMKEKGTHVFPVPEKK